VREGDVASTGTAEGDEGVCVDVVVVVDGVWGFARVVVGVEADAADGAGVGGTRQSVVARVVRVVRQIIHRAARVV